MPGGFVVHIYALDGELIYACTMDPARDLEADAERDADAVTALANGRQMIMVLFDGDTGIRTLPFGARPGEKLHRWIGRELS
jgi:hypothetical protein